MTPKLENTTSNRPSPNPLLGVALAPVDREALGRRPRAPALDERRDVVDRRHLREAARRGQRDVAIAAGDVEHPLVAAQIDRLAQRFADDLQRRPDDGVVARALPSVARWMFAFVFVVSMGPVSSASGV
jgi:hypothetical protein